MPVDRSAEQAAGETVTRAERLRQSAAAVRGTMRNVTSYGTTWGEPTDGYVMLTADDALNVADVLEGAAVLMAGWECDDFPQDCMTYSGKMCDTCLLKAALRRLG